MLNIADIEDDAGKSNTYLVGVLKQYPQYKCRVTSVYRKMSGSDANQEQDTHSASADAQRTLDASNINEPVGIGGKDGMIIAADSSYKDL